MTRYRWLRADWPINVRALAKQVRQQEFSEGQRSGFILDRVRDDCLEGRFVERYEYTETVSDPYGHETTIDRLEFRQSTFRATPGWPGLELLNAPRSTQSLVSGLLEASNFELAISPIDVDALAWADALQRALGVEATIDSLQLAALIVADGVAAKVLLKGDKDVRAACKAMVQGRKHVLEKLQLRVALGGARTTVVLTNTTGAKIEGGAVPHDLVALLRATIPMPTQA